MRQELERGWFDQGQRPHEPWSARRDREGDDAAVGVADEVCAAAEAGRDFCSIVFNHCYFRHPAVASPAAAGAGLAALPVVRAVRSEDVVARDSEPEPVDHLGAIDASGMNQHSERVIGSTPLMYVDGGWCGCGVHCRYLPLLSCAAASRLMSSRSA